MSVCPESKIYKIVNARLLIDHKIVEGSYLWFQNGKIIHPQNLFFDHHRDADEIIDAHGLLVVPGFIDTQINGGYGFDFADHQGSVETIKENINTIARGLLRYGCTSFCPTVVSSDANVYAKVLPLLQERKGSATTGATILGAHVEGPFISVLKKGAHEQTVLREASRGLVELDQMYGPALQQGGEAVRIITLAPEVKGVIETIPALVKRGITVSLGHSACTIAEAEEAVRHGATSITHLFNAMQAFHHRDPGLIGVIGAADLPIPKSPVGHPRPSQTSPCRTKPDPRPFYGLICDGVHVHPNSVRIAYYSHPHGAVLVTDALSSMGLPPGTYTLGGRDVEVDASGSAHIKGTNTLAGSTITIDQCIRNFQRFTNCTTVEAVEAATLHPAQMLGIADRKGTLNVGADADFVFLDDSSGELIVRKVFVDGEQVNLD